MLLILALGLLPSTAWANAGTPLMWASILHLVFGNTIIGVIEGMLLAWIFKCSKWKSMLILIAANYASAWAGGYLVTSYLASLPDITIQTIRFWFLVFVLIAFAVTLLIEFPFFWFALRSRERSLRRALVATPVIHGISYMLLLGWYWAASETSMMTRLEVVSADEMKISESYALYFLSRDGKQVCHMDLNGSDVPHSVAEVMAPHRNDRLFVRPRSDSGFDLLVYLDSEDRGKETEAKILEDFAEDAAVDERIAKDRSGEVHGSWFNFGAVPTVATESDWKFRTGFWSAEGISGHHEATGRKLRYSLELPFAAWPVRNAVHLSGDYVVAQLGDDQICMLHPESGKISLIGRGKGPVVAKPKIQKTGASPAPGP
ncbi:MAG: hypothetical protein QM627_07535 [Luteolibacter sp.]